MKKFLFLTVSYIAFVHRAADAMLPLHRAVSVGDKDQVDFLLKNSDTNVNQPDDDGCTPLHWAAYKGHEAIARLLLEHGAKVNLQNSYGSTPLHWAANKGHEAVARLLLEHGANVNQPDNYGSTPLHRAAGRGREAVDHLLQEWSQKLHASAARLAFYFALHPRAGAKSQARDLPQYSIREILQHVQPSDFPAIPAVVAPVVPAPTVPQQAWQRYIIYGYH